MSWQSYIDNLMNPTNGFKHVGIFGVNDGSTWASTPNFPLDVAKIKKIILSINNAEAGSDGIKIGDDKYIFLRNDEGASVIFKKNLLGIVATKSNQAVIIGVHDEKVKTEIPLNAAGKISDYLSKSGY